MDVRNLTTHWKIRLAILLIAVSVRVGAIYIFPVPTVSDASEYLSLGWHLRHQHTFSFGAPHKWGAAILRGRRDAEPVLLFTMFVLLIQFPAYAQPRYSMPVMPELLLLASFAASRIAASIPTSGRPRG